MVVAVTEIIQLLSTLSEEENIRVTVTQAAKGGLLAGGGAFIGGILGGPPGICAGTCTIALLNQLQESTTVALSTLI